MKKQIILPIVIIAIAGLVIGGFFLFRSQTSDEIESNNPDTPSTNEIAQTDSTRFAEEYNIATDNIFVYRNSEEIIKILEHGTGIVFLGFPECPWCRAYAPILNDVAKSNGIDKIYYYNIADDRRNNTATYQKLISILNDNLLYDEEGNHRVYVPDITSSKTAKLSPMTTKPPSWMTTAPLKSTGPQQRNPHSPRNLQITLNSFNLMLAAKQPAMPKIA